MIGPQLLTVEQLTGLVDCETVTNSTLVWRVCLCLKFCQLSELQVLTKNKSLELQKVRNKQRDENEHDCV